MSIIAYKDILRLEIAVDNPKHVKVFQCKEDLTYIEPATPEMNEEKLL